MILPLPGASGVSTGELSRRIVYTVRRGGNPAQRRIQHDQDHQAARSRHP